MPLTLCVGHRFSWINEWSELTVSGATRGMEIILPDWFYQGILNERLVLALDPAYSPPTGGSSAGSTASPANTVVAARKAGDFPSKRCTKKAAA